MNVQAQRVMVWIADRFALLLLAGLALAAIIVVVFPGVAEWIKANVAVAIIGGIVIGMGIGVVVLYSMKAKSQQ